MTTMNLRGSVLQAICLSGEARTSQPIFTATAANSPSPDSEE
jgi:hypothetical protein